MATKLLSFIRERNWHAANEEFRRLTEEKMCVAIAQERTHIFGEDVDNVVKRNGEYWNKNSVPGYCDECDQMASPIYKLNVNSMLSGEAVYGRMCEPCMRGMGINHRSPGFTGKKLDEAKLHEAKVWKLEFKSRPSEVAALRNAGFQCIMTAGGKAVLTVDDAGDGWGAIGAYTKAFKKAGLGEPTDDHFVVLNEAAEPSPYCTKCESFINPASVKDGKHSCGGTVTNKKSSEVAHAAYKNLKTEAAFNAIADPQKSLKTRQDAVNKFLADDVGRKYHRSIPLDAVFAKLRDNGFEPIQEDGTPWSGLLLGKDGKMNVELNTTNNGKPAKRYLSMSWHKMEVTGNFEVVAYVS